LTIFSPAFRQGWRELASIEFASMQTRGTPSRRVGLGVVSPAMNPVIESLSKRLLVKVAAFIRL